MDVQGIFAALVVSDLETAVAWTTKLLGRPPDDRPMETLAQWRHDGAGLQLFADTDKAGRSRATLVTPSMANARADLAVQGLTLGPDIAGDFGIVAQITDPDGNLVTLAEPPTGTD